MSGPEDPTDSQLDAALTGANILEVSKGIADPTERALAEQIGAGFLNVAQNGWPSERRSDPPPQ